MAFVSYKFLLFFLPLTALLTALVRKRGLQNAVLAAASVFFYAGFGASGLILLAYCAAVTWLFGWAGYCLSKKGLRAGRWAYIAGIVLNFLPLIIDKYGRFAVENANRLLAKAGIALPLPNWVVFVGLSFFIFQSSTYLLDLLRGRIQPEKNPINHLLFVSFFPTVTCGPIQRAAIFLPQIRQRDRVSLERVQRAAVLFMWGAFLKLVLSDRLAVLTDAVFGGYRDYGGLVLLIGACAYSVQIYADFLGYSCMAIAVAALFGFELADNFRQPYLATGMADFWHRWHISLTSWLTDYIYIPLGGSRRGLPRRYANILIVFLISGIWHGAAWHYAVWGVLHAVFQIFGHATLPARQALCAKLGIDRSTRAYRCWQRAFVFLLVTAAWVFFRMNAVASAALYLLRTVSIWNPWILTDGTLSQLGLTQADWTVCLLGIAVLILVSLHRERVGALKASGGMVLRLAAFILLLCATVLFGRYGGTYVASDFIYAGF